MRHPTNSKLGLTTRSARRLLIASGALGGLCCVNDLAHGAIGWALPGGLAVLVAAISLAIGPRPTREEVSPDDTPSD